MNVHGCHSKQSAPGCNNDGCTEIKICGIAHVRQLIPSVKQSIFCSGIF